MDFSPLIEKLSYDPRCSWVINDSQVYFNKQNLSLGEQFKVLVYSPFTRHDDLDLIVSAVKDSKKIGTESTHEKVLRKSLEHVKDPYQSTIISTKDELQTGSYLAQVLPSWVDPEKEPDSIWAQHSFDVFEPDLYSERFENLFGEVWDKPIYLDKLEPEQAEEILIGLPNDDFLSILPESTVLNNRTICHLVGPIITAFMTSAMGPLPFQVDYRADVKTEDLPHIDLIKLIWLFNVLSPVWADMMFFSSRNIVSSYVQDYGLSVYIETQDTNFYPTSLEIKEKVETSPLFRIVNRNITKDLDCYLSLEPPHKAMLEVKA